METNSNMTVDNTNQNNISNSAQLPQNSDSNLNDVNSGLRNGLKPKNILTHHSGFGFKPKRINTQSASAKENSLSSSGGDSTGNMTEVIGKPSGVEGGLVNGTRGGVEDARNNKARIPLAKKSSVPLEGMVGDRTRAVTIREKSTERGTMKTSPADTSKQRDRTGQDGTRQGRGQSAGRRPLATSEGSSIIAKKAISDALKPQGRSGLERSPNESRSRDEKTVSASITSSRSGSRLDRSPAKNSARSSSVKRNGTNGVGLQQPSLVGARTTRLPVNRANAKSDPALNGISSNGTTESQHQSADTKVKTSSSDLSNSSADIGDDRQSKKSARSGLNTARSGTTSGRGDFGTPANRTSGITNGRSGSGTPANRTSGTSTPRVQRTAKSPARPGLVSASVVGGSVAAAGRKTPTSRNQSPGARGPFKGRLNSSTHSSGDEEGLRMNPSRRMRLSLAPDDENETRNPGSFPDASTSQVTSSSSTLKGADLGHVELGLGSNGVVVGTGPEGGKEAQTGAIVNQSCDTGEAGASTALPEKKYIMIEVETYNELLSELNFYKESLYQLQEMLAEQLQDDQISLNSTDSVKPTDVQDLENLVGPQERDSHPTTDNIILSEAPASAAAAAAAAVVSSNGFTNAADAVSVVVANADTSENCINDGLKSVEQNFCSTSSTPQKKQNCSAMSSLESNSKSSVYQHNAVRESINYKQSPSGIKNQTSEQPMRARGGEPRRRLNTEESIDSLQDVTGSMFDYEDGMEDTDDTYDSSVDASMLLASSSGTDVPISDESSLDSSVVIAEKSLTEITKSNTVGEGSNGNGNAVGEGSNGGLPCVQEMMVDTTMVIDTTMVVDSTESVSTSCSDNKTDVNMQKSQSDLGSGNSSMSEDQVVLDSHVCVEDSVDQYLPASGVDHQTKYSLVNPRDVLDDNFNINSRIDEHLSESRSEFPGRTENPPFCSSNNSLGNNNDVDMDKAVSMATDNDTRDIIGSEVQLIKNIVGNRPEYLELSTSNAFQNLGETQACSKLVSAYSDGLNKNKVIASHEKANKLDLTTSERDNISRSRLIKGNASSSQACSGTESSSEPNVVLESSKQRNDKTNLSNVNSKSKDLSRDQSPHVGRHQPLSRLPPPACSRAFGATSGSSFGFYGSSRNVGKHRAQGSNLTKVHSVDSLTDVTSASRLPNTSQSTVSHGSQTRLVDDSGPIRGRAGSGGRRLPRYQQRQVSGSKLPNGDCRVENMALARSATVDLGGVLQNNKSESDSQSAGGIFQQLQQNNQQRQSNQLQQLDKPQYQMPQKPAQQLFQQQHLKQTQQRQQQMGEERSSGDRKNETSGATTSRLPTFGFRKMAPPGSSFIPPAAKRST